MLRLSERERISLLMMRGWGDRLRSYNDVRQLFNETFRNEDTAISRSTVERTIRRFNETGSVKNRPVLGRHEVLKQSRLNPYCGGTCHTRRNNTFRDSALTQRAAILLSRKHVATSLSRKRKARGEKAYKLRAKYRAPPLGIAHQLCFSPNDTTATKEDEPSLVEEITSRKRRRPAPLQSGRRSNEAPRTRLPVASLPPRGITSARGSSQPMEDPQDFVPRSRKVIRIRIPTSPNKEARKIVYDPSLIPSLRRPGGRTKTGHSNAFKTRDVKRACERPKAVLRPVPTTPLSPVVSAKPVPVPSIPGPERWHADPDLQETGSDTLTPTGLPI
ncbi:hypothetical protein EAG_04168 [Camponotus floridanus]|uniref:Uncharacterized protein n=1 Tax=Camponotus floridanus TaxID=104421 RepID=E1ZXH1_CAMFO|nr:hypothetical protein EAG_04168 [Camponotus floridanus]